ncbi:MAG: hypothetical protein AUJ54_09870 [Ignavibacteria bacterium CG1_02_37_35]|nr:MAG: hypothetical protein AUJ54_09870 [Ignavibacteria bacterium CG1_02_37_35]
MYGFKEKENKLKILNLSAFGGLKIKIKSHLLALLLIAPSIFISSNDSCIKDFSSLSGVLISRIILNFTRCNKFSQDQTKYNEQ